MSKDPWVKFFPSDFLSGVAGLSAGERGVYITLLATMYDHAGPIRRDDSRLARLCGLPKVGFARAIGSLLSNKKLVELDGWIFNDRVKTQLSERENRKLTASENSQSRWDKTKQLQGPSDTKTMPNGCEPDATRAVESEPESESYKNLVAIATSSTGEVDLFERQSKKLEKVESDRGLLDEITDVWNRWASRHGPSHVSQVKFLTGKRAISCRRRVADITNGHGPIVAFEEFLTVCDKSFFVKGTPNQPLKFDQVMQESFMVKMMEGAFEHRAPEARSGGTWRR